MVHFHEISAGDDASKVSLTKFSTKRVCAIAFAITPVILFGSVANATNPSGILTFEQCKEIVEQAESLKSLKALKAIRKGSGWYVTGAVCKAAHDKAAEETKKARTPLQVIAWSTLMLLCGSLITLHVLEE